MLLLLVLLLLLLQLFEHVLFVALLCRLFKCGPLDIEIFLALAGVRILGRHVCLFVRVRVGSRWVDDDFENSITSSSFFLFLSSFRSV